MLHREVEEGDRECELDRTLHNEKTVKVGGIKFTQQSLRPMRDSKISMFSSPSNTAGEWSQEYLLSVVLSGTNKICSKQQ